MRRSFTTSRSFPVSCKYFHPSVLQQPDNPLEASCLHHFSRSPHMAQREALVSLPNTVVGYQQSYQRGNRLPMMMHSA